MVNETFTLTEIGGIEQGDAALETFLNRKKEERIRMPFPPAIEGPMQVLEPTIRSELATILRTPATAPGEINFARSADGTKLIAVNAVVDARRVAIEAGCEVTDLASLATQNAVNAILGQVPSKLSGQRVLMILVQLQRLMTVSTGNGTMLLADAIAKVAGTPRRDIDCRVFSPDSYRNAAIALSRIADLLAAGTGRQRRVRTLKRDAALLGFASVGHLRESEYENLDVGDVRIRYDADGSEIVTVSAHMTKTKKKGRIIKISDPRLAKMVLALAEGDKNAPLFRNHYGRRLSASSIWLRFQILGVLGVGKPASANILRRSRSLKPGTSLERSQDLGNGPQTVERYYKPNLALVGSKAVQEANAIARQRISEARVRSRMVPGRRPPARS